MSVHVAVSVQLMSKGGSSQQLHEFCYSLYIYIYIYMCVCVCVCVYICVCVCVCVVMTCFFLSWNICVCFHV